MARQSLYAIRLSKAVLKVENMSTKQTKFVELMQGDTLNIRNESGEVLVSIELGAMDTPSHVAKKSHDAILESGKPTPVKDGPKRIIDV